MALIEKKNGVKPALVSIPSISVQLGFEKPTEWSHVLGAICYSGIRTPGNGFFIPLNNVKTEPVWEVIYTNSAVSLNALGDISYGQSNDAIFASIEVSEGEHGGILNASEYIYSQMIQFQQRHPDYQILKIWNYLDDITVGDLDDQRYKHFCVGRARACEDNWQLFPAGCALGTRQRERHLRVFWVATTFSAQTVENPRQTSAYQYPREYSPKAPLFSRSVRSQGQWWISGTASIIQAQSVHHGSVEHQFLEIFRNFEALLGNEYESFLRTSQFKVYLKTLTDSRAVLVQFDNFGISANRIFIFESDICREELLIEIEPVFPTGNDAQQQT